MTVVANLDAEAAWAAAAGVADVTPPERVMRPLAALGTLLRVLCEQGEPLWLPRRVAANRMEQVPGLPWPKLLSGRLMIKVSRRWAREEDARFNHRRWAHQRAPSLPGARWVRSLPELEEALADGAAEAGAGRWVLKPAFSAAGRDRLLVEGPPGESERRRARELLVGGGALLEPWVERTADHGARLWIDDDGARLDGLHGQLIDGGGRFGGVELAPELPPGIAEALGEAALALGQQLHAEGYRGPASVDSYRWLTPAGIPRLNATGELNARWSFGWIAARLAAAVGGGRRLVLTQRQPPEGLLLLDVGERDRWTATLCD